MRLLQNELIKIKSKVIEKTESRQVLYRQMDHAMNYV